MTQVLSNKLQSFVNKCLRKILKIYWLFLGGETKDLTHRTACIMHMKCGAVRKFSRKSPDICNTIFVAGLAGSVTVIHCLLSRHSSGKVRL